MNVPDVPMNQPNGQQVAKRYGWRSPGRFRRPEKQTRGRISDATRGHGWL